MTHTILDVPRLDGSARPTKFDVPGYFTESRPAVGEYFTFQGVLRLRKLAALRQRGNVVNFWPGEGPRDAMFVEDLRNKTYYTSSEL